MPGHSVQLADGEDLEREAGDEVKNGGYAILGRAEQFRILDQAGSDVTANYNVTVKSGSFTICADIQDAAKTAGQADPFTWGRARRRGCCRAAHPGRGGKRAHTRGAGGDRGHYPSPGRPGKAGESF